MGFEPTLYIAVDVGFKTVSKVVGVSTHNVWRYNGRMGYWKPQINCGMFTHAAIVQFL